MQPIVHAGALQRSTCAAAQGTVQVVALCIAVLAGTSRGSSLMSLQNFFAEFIICKH